LGRFDRNEVGGLFEGSVEFSVEGGIRGGGDSSIKQYTTIFRKNK
jgi:hypothetical protein